MSRPNDIINSRGRAVNRTVYGLEPYRMVTVSMSLNPPAGTVVTTAGIRIMTAVQDNVA